jgi:uncharacterized protein YndB with AHSA1/START domain
MTWLWITLGTLLGLVALVLATGAMIDRKHVATVRETYQASPDEIWTAITTFERMPDWRKGLKQVEVLEPLGGLRRIREHTGFGPMTYVVDEEIPSQKLVLRIADRNQGFGGTWTYQLHKVEGGTELSITEDGFIDNLLFRFMARFIFGYEGTMRRYHEDLRKKLAG